MHKQLNRFNWTNFSIKSGDYYIELNLTFSLLSNLNGKTKHCFRSGKAAMRQSKYLIPVLKVLFQGLSLADRFTSYLFSHRRQSTLSSGNDGPCHHVPGSPPSIYLKSLSSRMNYYRYNIIFQFMPKCKESLKKLKLI